MSVHCSAAPAGAAGAGIASLPPVTHMDINRNHVAAWVAEKILPHEAAVRGWLTRHWRATVDVDDVVQEAYCRIAELDSVEHIRNGRAYFFTTARAIAIDTIRSAPRRNSVSLTEDEWSSVMDEAPSPERAAEAGQELEQAKAVLSRLSWTCRRVIELRRVRGLSQAETARVLGVSENVVENHIVRGIRRLLQVMAAEDAAEPGRGEHSCSPRDRTGGQKKQRDGRRA